MATPVTVRRSRIIDAPIETVFDTALSTPLPQLYRRRFGPLPPIVEVRDQQGAWQTPGQTRVFVLGDGGEMREEVLAIERPSGFTNRLTVLRGPFKPLVATVEEAWSFREVGTGTEATWEWNLFRRSVASSVLVSLVGRLWLGYAGAVLEQLAEEVRGA